MLREINKRSSSGFEMILKQENHVEINFTKLHDFLEGATGSMKIVFIDPVVLVNMPGLLDIEDECGDMVLVPTKLHESNKDFDSLVSILNVLEQNGVGRRGDLIFAVGGGALLDTVSFAASIFRRGINVIKVPTTLLAIVDAAIGIKTGINFEGQRNRLGSYHFNYQVIIDPVLMRGLSVNLLRQGLGEIFKISTIKSFELFKLLLDNRSELQNVEFYSSEKGIYILKESIRLMLEELHDNPREDNLMRCVDFGHSFSPLVEMESIKRSCERALPHGYAVAYDCLLTSLISYKRGLISDENFNLIFNLYTSVDFDFKNPIYNDYNIMWASFLEMTKHRGGRQNLPVPTFIGEYSFIQDVTFDEMVMVAKELQGLLDK